MSIFKFNVDYYFRRLRELDISQNECARRADLSKESLSHYANERVLPSVSALYKLARALGVSMEELLVEVIINV